MIVEVITEGLDQADGLLTAVLGDVTGEQNEGHKGNVVANLKALHSLKLDGGITGVEENLGRVLEGGLTPGIDEFL